MFCETALSFDLDADAEVQDDALWFQEQDFQMLDSQAFEELEDVRYLPLQGAELVKKKTEQGMLCQYKVIVRPGVCCRHSPSIMDRDKLNRVEAGTIVHGVLSGDKWLKVHAGCVPSARHRVHLVEGRWRVV